MATQEAAPPFQVKVPDKSRSRSFKTPSSSVTTYPAVTKAMTAVNPVEAQAQAQLEQKSSNLTNSEPPFSKVNNCQV